MKKSKKVTVISMLACVLLWQNAAGASIELLRPYSAQSLVAIRRSICTDLEGRNTLRPQAAQERLGRGDRYGGGGRLAVLLGIKWGNFYSSLKQGIAQVGGAA